MVRFAWSYLKDVDDARDVVQDVFLGLWEKKNNLNSISNMEAWCMKLVRNKSLDKLKRADRKKRASISDVNYNHKEANDLSPLENLANKETMSHVLKVVDTLPEDQASSFNLRDIQGYSYIEISEILGISLSSVKVNIFRARKHLKDKLKESYQYGTEEI
jgi:RNA polymerase sigma-70 factor (ECF subfamily)